MKKGLSFFLVAAVLITVGLRFLNSMQFGQTGPDGVVETQIEEITLNEFIENYNTSTFEKVVLKDAMKLE
jgi:hypothetical protein